MKSTSIGIKLLLVFTYCCLGIALSCTDHVIPNDPKSACMKLFGGGPREYPCEFEIVKLTFYAKDHSVLGEVTPDSPNILLSRSKAKTDSKEGVNTLPLVGNLTYDVKATIRRIASPSFPVVTGYQLRSTIHVSGPAALTTPGESSQVGDPVMLNMPIGGTEEVSFELSCLYELYDSGSGIMPRVFRGLTAFLIYNDVTSVELDNNPSAIGNVAETYVRITNTVGL